MDRDMLQMAVGIWKGSADVPAEPNQVQQPAMFSWISIKFRQPIQNLLLDI